jgi:hypothetical protein
MKMTSLVWLSFLIALPALSQNLMEERIWKISPRKKSIFLDAGVFHHNSEVKNSGVTSVRSSHVPGRGFERVVIDFNTATIPKIYGHISSATHKISIDFFDTGIMTTQPQLKDSQFVKNIDFINVDGKSTTMDLTLKGKTSFDVFYLDSPGRLVIDIR